MYNKQGLAALSPEQLKQIAEELHLHVLDTTTPEELIAAILDTQTEGSLVIGHDPDPVVEERPDHSTVVSSPEDIPKSQVIGGNDATSEPSSADFTDATNLSKKIQPDGSILIGESIIIQNQDAVPGERDASDFLLHLKSGYKLKLKEKEYEILDILSPLGRSLEAVIYKVKDEEGLLKVVKLYANHNDPTREPNAEALERIKAIEDEDVLKLYDFGVGADKVFGDHCFEISDFASGGNLLEVVNFKAKYNYDFIKNYVIREIFNGIKCLHRSGIIHCDLKPRNIFYLDQEQTDLVIGDYGSAKTRGTAEQKDVKVASRVIGNYHYLAPEQLERVISEKNDYYSLGMILIHLLYPEQFAKDKDFSKVDRKKFDRLTQKKWTGGKILDFNPIYADVNRLIKGLIDQRSIQARWGKQEVEDWLKDTDTKFETSSLKEMGLFLAKNPAAYLNKPKKEKRISFLKKISRHELIYMDYEEFLFKVFEQEAKIKLEILHLSLNSDRKYSVDYQYQLSLSDFFKENEIENSQIRELHEPQKFTDSKGLFERASSLFNNFIEFITKKHGKDGQSIIDEQEHQRVQQYFRQQIKKQNRYLNLSESYTAALLWLPLLLMMALFYFRDFNGNNLLQQMGIVSGLDLYAQHAAIYNNWWGLYLIYAGFALFLMLSFLPSFWMDHRWEAVNKKNNYLLLMSLMALLPAGFGLANYLPEWGGILVYLTIFIGLLMSLSIIKNQHNQDIVKFISGMLMLLFLYRLGMWIVSFFQNSPGESNASYHGIFEIAVYVLIFFTLQVLPVYRQVFRLYHPLHLALKSALILGLLFLIVLLLG